MLFDDLLNNPAKWMVESRDEHDIGKLYIRTC